MLKNETCRIYLTAGFVKQGENKMKDFIVVIALIILGCFIAVLIIGNGSSLKTASKGLMQKQIEILGD